MLSQCFTFQRRHLLSVPPVDPTQQAGETLDQVSCVRHMAVTWLPGGHRAELWPELCHSLGLLPKKAPLENALAVDRGGPSAAVRLHVPGVL